MEKLSVLPTTIYKYTLPDEVYSSICNVINKVNFNTPNRDEEIFYGKSSYGKEISLHKQEEWSFLNTYLNPKLYEIALDIGYEYFEAIKVCLMWANKSELNQWHHGHQHPYSILSGIIYVEGEAGDTWFSRRNDYALENRMFNGLRNSPEDQIIYKHKPENKTMLVFPSMLMHSVTENISNIERKTISFNSYFDGKIGDIEKLCGLEIKLL